MNRTISSGTIIVNNLNSVIVRDGSNMNNPSGSTVIDGTRVIHGTGDMDEDGTVIMKGTKTVVDEENGTFVMHEGEI